MMGRRWPWFVPLVILGVVLVTTLPYFLAAQAAGAGYVFGGFLLNPLDGNSYLAKMYEGWRGEWLFTLPYSPEVSRGSFIYLFYLILGHLARWLSADLGTMYHAARIIGAVILLLVLYDFIKVVLPDEPLQVAAFILTAVGSGLGWLALGSGIFTPDFWVAEGYPFLSIYSNPHFVLSLALILWLIKPPISFNEKTISLRQVAYFSAAFILGLLAPFGVILALLILGGEIAWRWKALSLKNIKSWLPPRFMWILLGGGLPILYELWVIRSDPIMASWNAQNLTPSPRFWQLLVALSPALVLALAGVWFAVRRGTTGLRGLVIWLLAGLVLMYLPWGLQRRFMLGLFIPAAILGVYGLSRLANLHPRRFTYGMILLIAFSLPTNMIVLLAARQGVATHDPQIYLRRDEANALDWILKNTPENALILSAPGTGLFIPAYTGRRVIYGHPYETVDAKASKLAVTKFYESNGQTLGDLGRFDIDYVFWGPREQALGSRLDRPNLRQVYQSGDVIVYAWDWVK
jgi:hypothetical protein